MTPMLHFITKQLTRFSRHSKVLVYGGVTTLGLVPTISCISDYKEYSSTPIKLPKLDYSKAAYTQEKTMVIFVIGGPGAGKGTQCFKLAEAFPELVHLSAGDLLREERSRDGSQYGEMINAFIAEGKIVPMEITINLLKNAMGKSSSSKFLIDGFPRAIDQGVAFEKAVCKSSAVVFLECPENILEERLLKRGALSGRIDDNRESIRKRFRTFIDTSLPVVDYYKHNGNVYIVDSSGPMEQVFERAKQVVQRIIKENSNVIIE